MTDFCFRITIGGEFGGEAAVTDRMAALHALAARLPAWYASHARDLPWRQDREPYHVWLSEIMLQQTRAEAVKGYYTRFLAAVPDIPALAAADPELLRKLWEGLGYYSRVRNLQAAARQIMYEHGGVFPTACSAVRALKGVGDYTAGAICSICFDLPTPAVDGNVLRVLSRLTLDHRCIDDPAVKRAVRDELTAVYPQTGAGTLTQALMELGATVCLPNGAPRCEVCPMRELCAAARDGLWTGCPVRAKKAPRRVEELTVFALSCGGKLALRQRPEQGLLAGLWAPTKGSIHYGSGLGRGAPEPGQAIGAGAYLHAYRLAHALLVSGMRRRGPCLRLGRRDGAGPEIRPADCVSDVPRGSAGRLNHSLYIIIFGG